MDSAEPNSKGIFLRLLQHFVDARFLLVQDFCRHEIFVNARILSAQDFFQRKIFVDARVLSARDFCQRENFVLYIRGGRSAYEFR